MDDKSIFKGLKYWRGTMSSSGFLVSDKYELLPQNSYAGKNDFRYSY
jgi:hypothetical protein